MCKPDRGKDEKTYIVELEPGTIEELKQYGHGTGAPARSVNVIGKSAIISASVDKIAINQPKGACLRYQWLQNKGCQ